MTQTSKTMRRKSLPGGHVKVLDRGRGIVEAFCAGIGNKDSGGDILMPGAFCTLPGVAPPGLERRPKVVFSHDWTRPIGRVLECREVLSGPELPPRMRNTGAGGLYAKMEFLLTTQDGRDAFEVVKFFAETGEAEWSIGFSEIESEWSQELQANLLKRVELFELSPVVHGMNRLTETVGFGAKSLWSKWMMEGYGVPVDVFRMLLEVEMLAA